MKINILAPSLLSARMLELQKQLDAAAAGGADWWHLDVMDGCFVPNITFGPALVAEVKQITKLPLDVHLMIQRPEQMVEPFARAGARYLTVHQEATPHLQRVIQQIRDAGCRPGVAVNPATGLDFLPHLLPDLDLLLIMTVNPGFGGQRFLDTMLPKITRASELIAKYNPRCLLEVDGGIKPENIATVAAAGAQVLVAGSAVFATPDPGAAAAELKRLLQENNQA
jgi:ribulose-phosphate 3-epimerase